jgi:hypothetical protein
MQGKPAKSSWLSILVLIFLLAVLYIGSEAPVTLLWKKAGYPKRWTSTIQTIYRPVKFVHHVRFLRYPVLRYWDWWDTLIIGPVDDPATTRPDIP